MKSYTKYIKRKKEERNLRNVQTYSISATISNGQKSDGSRSTWSLIETNSKQRVFIAEYNTLSIPDTNVAVGSLYIINIVCQVFFKITLN